MRFTVVRATFLPSTLSKTSAAAPGFAITPPKVEAPEIKILAADQLGDVWSAGGLDTGAQP